MEIEENESRKIQNSWQWNKDTVIFAFEKVFKSILMLRFNKVFFVFVAY